MDCTELRILSYQRDRCFIQDIAQSLSSTVTDPAFSVVLTGIICNNRISCKLLQLLWVIKTSNVTHLCNKSTHGYHPDPLDLQQLIYIWDLFQLVFKLLYQFFQPRCVNIHIPQ